MRETDKPKFLAVLNGLAAVKPGAKLTTEGLDVWWHAFADWCIEDFTAAAAQLTKTVEFFPNPFHFEQLRKASELTAGEAWAEVLQIARNGNDYHGDPRVEKAVRAIGGFKAVSMSRTDQTHFLERRFCEHYEAITDVEQVRDALPNFLAKRLPYDPKRFLE